MSQNGNHSELSRRGMGSERGEEWVETRTEETVADGVRKGVGSVADCVACCPLVSDAVLVVFSLVASVCIAS